MKVRIYVTGSQYIETDASEKEAGDIVAAYDNRALDRIRLKHEGEIWDIAKSQIVAIAYINETGRPKGTTLN